MHIKTFLFDTRRFEVCHLCLFTFRHENVWKMLQTTENLTDKLSGTIFSVEENINYKDPVAPLLQLTRLYFIFLFCWLFTCFRYFYSYFLVHRKDFHYSNFYNFLFCVFILISLCFSLSVFTFNPFFAPFYTKKKLNLLGELLKY